MIMKCTFLSSVNTRFNRYQYKFLDFNENPKFCAVSIFVIHTLLRTQCFFFFFLSATQFYFQHDTRTFNVHIVLLSDAII